MRHKTCRRKQKYELSGTLTPSPYTMHVGICCLLASLLMLMLSIKPLNTEQILLSLLFLIISCLLILRKNWKITYDTEGFSYRNSFGITKYYQYSQITRINAQNSNLIYIGRKRILIDNTADGKQQFLMQAEALSKISRQSVEKKQTRKFSQIALVRK